MYQLSMKIFALKHENIMQLLLMKPPTINVGFYIVVTTDKDQTILIMLSLMDIAFENSTENCFQGILQLL